MIGYSHAVDDVFGFPRTTWLGRPEFAWGNLGYVMASRVFIISSRLDGSKCRREYIVIAN